MKYLENFNYMIFLSKIDKILIFIELLFIYFNYFYYKLTVKIYELYFYHILFRSFLILNIYKRYNWNLKLILSSLISCILITNYFIFILGGFYLKIWIIPSISFSITILIPLLFNGINYYVIFGILGFLIGSFSFPLDWPVFWKESPFSQVILYPFLSLIGGILDFYFIY